jgi:hypothetical protein
MRRWRPGDRVCDPRGPRIEPSVTILGSEFDGFRFTTVGRHITGSCWRFTKLVCPSAEAPPRDGASPRLGRNLFASGRAFAAEEPGVARFATSGVISGRGLRIATWKAGGQPGPDPGNTAPQPGKSGLFPISGWSLACRTSRTARLDRTACRGARSRRNRHGRERDHYRTSYFSHSGKYFRPCHALRRGGRMNNYSFNEINRLNGHQQAQAGPRTAYQDRGVGCGDAS